MCIRDSGKVAIGDFAKLDLRVATVLDAKTVDGSDKLLQLTLDLGTEKRNVFSGIRAGYGDPAKLVGRQVIMVANLEPRKMRFGVSEGMVLCAAPDAGGAREPRCGCVDTTSSWSSGSS